MATFFPIAGFIYWDMATHILLHDWEGNTGEIFCLRLTISARP